MAPACRTRASGLAAERSLVLALHWVAVCAVLLGVQAQPPAPYSPLGGSGTSRSDSDDPYKISAENSREILLGFEAGLDPDQDRTSQERCMRSLDEVGGPLLTFLENVTTACSSTMTDCVPATMQGLGSLQGSQQIQDSLMSSCPPKLYLLFTASYDPFLPANMATMAVLHAAKLTRNVHTAFQALAKDEYHNFGYAMGRAIDAIFPRLRLPLHEEDMERLIGGFVSAFMRTPRSPAELPIDPMRVLPNLTGKNKSVLGITLPPPPPVPGFDSAEAVAKDCIANMSSELRPANEAIAAVAGSMLNVTCFAQIGSFRGFRCIQRAYSGIGSFLLVLREWYNLKSQLERSECPLDFVSAMRRFDDKAALTLDVVSNTIEDFGLIETYMLSGADAFYDGDLFTFGLNLGRIYKELTQPSFYKYQTLEVEWVRLTPLWRLLHALLVPPVLFLLSLAPLLCLFCSACWGRPPSYQEVVVHSNCLDTKLTLTYNFFGRGLYGIHSEVEFDVFPTLDGDTDNSAADVSAVIRAPTAGMPTEATDPESPESAATMAEQAKLAATECTEMLMCRADSDTSVASSDEEVSPVQGSPARMERLLFRLTDEWPEMSWWAYTLFTAVWVFLPCLARGRRRWEATRCTGFHDGNRSTWTEAPPEHRDVARSWTPSGFCGYQVTSDQESGDSANTAHDSSRSVPEVTEAEHTGVRRRIFVNGLEARAPLDDVAKPITFQVEDVASAKLRLKPATDFKECWDLLLFGCALAQLFASAWHLCEIVVLQLRSVLFGGGICTFFWCWCKFCAAVLVLHKKVHARWWVSMHQNHMRAKEKAFTCLAGILRVPRTPTPVQILEIAPGIRQRSDTIDEIAVSIRRRHTGTLVQAASSMTTPKEMLLLVLKTVRPYAYRYYHQLEKGDDVVLRPSRFPWSSPTCRTGRLNKEFPDEDGRHEILLSDETVVHLVRESFDLDPSHTHTARAGIWHDHLTSLLRNVTLILWAVCAVMAFCLPSWLITDHDGFLTLEILPVATSSFEKWVIGSALMVQVGCIVAEGAIRFVTWAVARLLLLFIYAGG